jgi:hypothetical protein
MRSFIYMTLASIEPSVVAFPLLHFDSDQISSAGMYSYIPVLELGDVKRPS